MVVESAQQTYRERAPRTPDGERHGGFLHGLWRLRVTVGRSPSEAEFLRLPASAASQSVTSHILSSRGGAPLATLDAALATAAGAERVPLLSY